jgi:hypothetical protein
VALIAFLNDHSARGKAFFFEKKKQKTSALTQSPACASWVEHARLSTHTKKVQEHGSWTPLRARECRAEPASLRPARH